MFAFEIIIPKQNPEKPVKTNSLWLLGLVAGLSVQADYRDTVLTDNPSGYWRLNSVPTPNYVTNSGLAGEAVNGLIGNAVKGEQAGAISGDSDKAMQFAGSAASRITVPFDPALNPAGSFSAEFWMNTALASGSALAPIYSRGGNPGYIVYIQGDGSLQFLQWSGAWQSASTGAGTVSSMVGKWVHVTCVFDASVGDSGYGTQLIYTNGVLAGSHEMEGPYENNPSGTFNIADRDYSGLLDELAVYDTALSSATILAHYQAGTNGTGLYGAAILGDRPVGYWRLNEKVASQSIANLGTLGSAGDGLANGSLITISETPLVGDSDRAMNFTAGGYIGLPYQAALNATAAFSYEVWYNEDAGSSGIRCPLWWRDEPALGDTRGWVHYLWDSWDPAWEGRGHVFQSSDTYTTWNGIGSPALFAQGEWQHLVCTFDGAHKQIYLNGVLVAVSTTAKLKVKPVQRAVTTISSTAYPFLGSLDEVAYYTNALAPERIQAHWKAARGVNPPAVAATFATQPKGLTAFEGSKVTLSALVLGTPPFTGQWQRNGTTLPNQTNVTLTLASALQSDTGDYVLKVTNAGGTATSDAAHVEVVAAPASIVQAPQAASRLQGATVTFAVQAGGSEPLAYQWLSNSVSILGATNASLTLTNIQTSFAADYSVSVTNTAGGATSSPAGLTVVPVLSGGYAATVVHDRPIAFWRLNETTPTVYDLVGGHDGACDTGLTQGVPGAVLGDPDKAITFAGAGGVTIPGSPDLNPFTAFSVELWARPDPAGAGTDRTLFVSRTTASGWHYGYYLAANASDQWLFSTGHKTSGVSTLTGGETTNPAWYHIVATFDANTGNKILYVNGKSVASSVEALGTFAPNNAVNEGSTSDEGIGKTTVSDAYIGEGAFFVGELDEVAVYDFALSPDQVARHYGLATSPTLDISRSGSQVQITWSQGVLLQASDLTGPWTTNGAASPFLLTPASGRQFFRVQAP